MSLQSIIQKTVVYKREYAYVALFKAQQLLEAVQAECTHPSREAGFKCPDCFKQWEIAVYSE